MSPRGAPSQSPWLTALVADRHGNIFDLAGFAAVGMSDTRLFPLTDNDTVNMPFGSELMMLPDRQPVVYDIHRHQYLTLQENPHRPGQPVYPVAVFNSPGYVVTLISAHKKMSQAGVLPLFSYGAVGWRRGRFRSAAMCIDRERRQDIRLMHLEDVRAGIAEKRRQLPNNRLRAHLEKCALTYGCPAGKNFFLKRYEAPLPTARQCNAGCLGCLSLQSTDEVPRSQDRIGFTPSAEEIAEVALSHIHAVKRAVVSFGQGCEGDPLLAVDVIEPAIRKIRAATAKGTIHINTNGSRPKVLDRLFKAGLDSMRISLNSAREPHYRAYFRPHGYTLADVREGIGQTLRQGKFVAINYLNCPGFTDTTEEFKALMDFLRRYRIHMIQWRNLNFDPIQYWKIMQRFGHSGKPLGMKRIVATLQQKFSRLRHGYFNPPKERF